MADKQDKQKRAKRTLNAAQREALAKGRAVRLQNVAGSEPKPKGARRVPKPAQQAAEPPRTPETTSAAPPAPESPPERPRRMFGPDTIIFPAMGTVVPEPEPEPVGEPMPEVEHYSRFQVVDAAKKSLFTGTADACLDYAVKSRARDADLSVMMIDPSGAVIEDEWQAARHARSEKTWKVELHLGGSIQRIFQGYPIEAVRAYNRHVIKPHKGTLILLNGHGMPHAQHCLPQFRTVVKAADDPVQVDEKTYLSQVDTSGRPMEIGSLDAANPEPEAPFRPERAAPPPQRQELPFVTSPPAGDPFAIAAPTNSSVEGELARLNRAIAHFTAVLSCLTVERSRVEARFAAEVGVSRATAIGAAADGYLILAGRK